MKLEILKTNNLFRAAIVILVSAALVSLTYIGLANKDSKNSTKSRINVPQAASDGDDYYYLESRIDDLQSRVDDIESGVFDNEAQISDLEGRIDDLEWQIGY